MDLTPYVDSLRNELAVAAGAGGEEARALAGRLTRPLESAARLALLDALSAAMDEVTRELAPGSVDVRLRGLDPEFVVTAPSSGPPDGLVVSSMVPGVAPVVAPDSEDGNTARINFRLPAQLKTRVEEAAGHEGLSANGWLVRAVAGALEPGAVPPRPAGRDPLAVPDRPPPRSGGGRRAPEAQLRLHFAGPAELAAAAGLFTYATPDEGALTLSIPGDSAVITVKIVLDVLENAGVRAESLTVHAADEDGASPARSGRAAR